jgi:mRNA interferase YafQ
VRTIERSTAFKRDYKRVKTIPRHRNVETILPEILALLLDDQPLPERNRDHALSGNWTGYRECHIKPDLLLIYKKPSPKVLRLARLGSHSDLFG